MMRMLTWMAVSLLSTEESVATPCSLKAYGSFLLPPGFHSELDVANCDIKFSYSSLIS